MEELLAQISTATKGMWRFRWQSLAVAWVIGIIGTVVVFRVPDRYEATARIYVDTQSILKPLMSGLAVQPDVEQQVVMLSRTLISRPNVEKLIRMADLDLKTESKADQEKLITDLTKSLQIKNVGRDNLYSLSFQDTVPAKAQRVIQALVSIFVESSLGAARQDTATAKNFLAEQIKSYEAKLEEAETKLKEFRLRNLDLQGGEGKDSATKVVSLGDELKQARLALREAEQSRDAAKQQLANEKSQTANLSTQSLLQESATVIATPAIDGRIDANNRALDALLQRFTEQHPDVVALRKQIKEMEEQKRKELIELRRAAASAPMAVNAPTASLVQQELGRMLATSEVQVAALRARVSEYETRYAQARESLKTAPQLEAEASQLNRDYAIHKKNYEDLVSRRESAMMSGDLESASGVADFRLIDPPRVSPNPVAPNRLLLVPISLVVALAAGLLTALAASQLRPVFHGAGELVSKTELPLLGVVSKVLSAADHRRFRVDLFRFLVCSGGLVSLFVAVFIGLSVMAARRLG